LSSLRRWLAAIGGSGVLFALTGCPGRAGPGAAVVANADGEALERRARADHTAARYRRYDEARARYAAACQAGAASGCDNQRRLDAWMKDTFGECASPVDCFEQARAWPGWRAEGRLRSLCLGRALDVDASVRRARAVPEWPPFGPACLALGEIYQAAQRDQDASAIYWMACHRLDDGQACRRDGQVYLGVTGALAKADLTSVRAQQLTRAAETLARGCQLGDAESCFLAARVALAHHALDFPDESALRYPRAGQEPRALLDAARRDMNRACALGLTDACDAVAGIDARAAHVDSLRLGCISRNTCGEAEFCNLENGRCEGPANPGEFFAVYQRGIDAFTARQYERARDAFESARDMAPALPGPWRWLSLVAFHQRRFRACAGLAAEALRRAPESPHAAELAKLGARCRGAPGR
jgi:tetratricopeptide (TPR) repeat protein